MSGGVAENLMVDVGEHLRRALAGAGDDADVVLDVLRSWLTEPTTTRHLVSAVLEAFHQAQSAHNLRDDIYGYPGGAETAALLAVDAITITLGAGRTLPPRSLAREDAEAALTKVTYRDWDFRVVDDPPAPMAVEVRAVVGDVRYPAQEFRISRASVIRDGDVVRAAFEAVLLVETHEAMERFTYDGKAIYNAHNPPPPLIRYVG